MIYEECFFFINNLIYQKPSLMNKQNSTKKMIITLIEAFDNWSTTNTHTHTFCRWRKDMSLLQFMKATKSVHTGSVCNFGINQSNQLERTVMFAKQNSVWLRDVRERASHRRHRWLLIKSSNM